MLISFFRHIVLGACYGLLMAFAFAMPGCKNKANNSPAIDADPAKAQQPSTQVAQVPSINALQSEGVAEAISFSLASVTFQTGTPGCVSLKAEGAVEGYFIKSLSICKDACPTKDFCTTTDYKAQFGLDAPSMSLLKKQSITAAGLNIQLNPSLRLKPDSYKLTIKLGKIGKGSAPTDQFV